MPLRPLEVEDRPLVEELLAENPFKREQIEFQKLDLDRLVAFHLRRIMDRVGTVETPLFVFDDGLKSGIFGYREIQKHSIFFEKLVFCIDFVISYKMDRRSILEALGSLQTKMARQGAETVWAQCDEADTNLIQSFGRAGADYCGTSLRMSLWMNETGAGPQPQGVRIRKAVREDRDALREIATRSHRHSRFFRDPHLPQEEKRKLFPDYLDRCLGADRHPCLVATDPSGRLSGFALLLCPQGQEESLGRRIGIVDFIAVDPERQGGGVGGALLGESLRLLQEEGYELVELKTQLDNRGAIGFYSRWGFRTISAQTHFSFGKKGD